MASFFISFLGAALFAAYLYGAAVAIIRDIGGAALELDKRISSSESLFNYISSSSSLISEDAEYALLI
jgi:hypothetical protein